MERAPLTISPWFLISIYGIIPICILMVVVDQLFLGRSLEAFLPTSPYLVFLSVLLFNVPHHVGSLIGFLDRDYIVRYRWHLIYVLAPLLVAYVALVWYFPLYGLLLLVIATEYHTVSQQVGVARIVSRLKGSIFALWRWTAIVFGVSIIFMLAERAVFDYVPLEVIQQVVVIAGVVHIAVLCVLLPQAKSLQGRIILTLTSIAFIPTAILIHIGYPILGLIIVRVIHDFTAFTFYITHDYNRNREVRHNFLYRWFTFTHIPLYLLTPVLAVGVAALIQFSPFVSALALTTFFMSHYYLEAIMWKKDAPHRAYVLVR